jgi:hypothetical protein
LLLVPKEVFHIKKKKKKKKEKSKCKTKKRAAQKIRKIRSDCQILPGLETDPFCPILPSL